MTVQGGKESNREPSKGKGGKPVDHDRPTSMENQRRRRVENPDTSERVKDDGQHDEPLQKTFQEAFVIKWNRRGKAVLQAKGNMAREGIRDRKDIGLIREIT